jgi:methyl-accepting chemotaxis protein
MLKSISFRGKIHLLVGVAFAGIFVLSAVSVWQVRTHIIDARRGQLVTAVESAYSVITGYRQRAASGQMTVAEAQKAAKDAIRLVRYGDEKKDYLYVFGLDGKGVVHPKKELDDGQDLFGKVKNPDGTDGVKALIDTAIKQPAGGTMEGVYPHPGSTVPVPKLQYVKSIPEWNWMVGSGLYMDEVDAQVWAAILGDVTVVAITLVALGICGLLITRSVLAQIGGDPADAVAAMRRVAEGDLSTSLGAARHGSLLAELEAMVASLRTTVGKVRKAVDSITVASSQIAAGNQDLSGRTEQQASALQETAASMEQLTSTVRQSEQSAKQAAQLANAASQAASEGGEVVGHVVTTMEQISGSSRKIAEIIGVIDGIAFQTNILALNAAVEAARAGEQGRGFAVVAGEVRSLAQRSAQAAREIKAMISDSVRNVEAGSRLVGDAGQSMTAIVEQVARVTSLISEIAGAAIEQSHGIGQVNEAVTHMDRSTQQNAALVEQAAAATSSLNDQATRLAEAISVFRLSSDLKHAG